MNIKEKIRGICEKIRFRRKLKGMDEIWSLYGGSCFGLFPPSVYHRHSEEEIEEMQREEIAKLNQILNDFQKRNECGR
ncbi:MAG: hypothetical protein NC420_06315 [Eubacterium sp.]|nr:hypothetical protein [Eubacterium sp.]MCM1214756.1 hypothetical protein [Lachnospiraceae bacterium]MCM1239575.1 hypothetical protein [Lachnospiraceae bacterium]